MTEPTPTQGQPPRWRPLAALLALFAAAYIPVALFVADHEGALYDDAFIYFRYADNLLAGCGFAFNCGAAPVEGFTSGLYLALLTGLHGLGLPLVDAATALGQLGTWSAALLAAALAASLLRGADPRLAWAGAIATLVALGSDGVWLLNAVTGLETALAAALCTVVALAMVRLRQCRESAGGGSAPGGTARGLGWAIWLAWLARPEAAVFGPAALVWPLGRDVPGGDRARSNRAVAARIFATLALLVGAVLAARWAIFGDWVANTARAKSGGSAAHLALGWAYLQEAAVDFPLLALAPLAALLARIRGLVGPFLAAAGVWALATLLTGGDHFAYSRMLAPLLPACTAITVAGAALGLQRLARRAPPLVAAAGLLVVFAGFGAQTAARHAIPELHAFPNVTRWLQVGAWLRDHRPGASIATVPIGAIGWVSGATLIDLVGLTEPAIARHGRALPPERLTRSWIGHERERTEWVLEQAPDLLVFTRSSSVPFSLATARAGFWAEWLLLQEIKAGRARYRVADAEVAPGLHWLVFERF